MFVQLYLCPGRTSFRPQAGSLRALFQATEFSCLSEAYNVGMDLRF